MSELVFGMGDFKMDMLVTGLRVVRVFMEEMELERKMWRERCC